MAGADPGTGASEGARLVVDAITVRFSGVVALDRVSFAVQPGEVLGIIGPNGAGKTTLFDVVSGLHRPSRGRVLIDGVDVTRRGPVARSRAGTRRTFQRQQVFGTLTVEENLLSAIEWRGGGGGMLADLVSFPTRRRLERRRRAAVAPELDRCGLAARRKSPASTLPIGTARMTELGRAMVDGPKILLLDEPTSGLGHGELALLSAQVERIRSEGVATVLLIEHDISFVMEHSDRIVALDAGHVIAVGTPAEIRDDAAVRDAYLG